MESVFISEDDLNTLGYLRLQAIDPSITPPTELAVWRKFFDEAMASRAATQKIGVMKFKPVPGEYRYGVAVRASPLRAYARAGWLRRRGRASSFANRSEGVDEFGARWEQFCS
jgi:hypothetical protein